MGKAIDFSRYIAEAPWKALLLVVKAELDRRMEMGDYGETPEREYPLHDLSDDLEMVEWILAAALPDDGKDRLR